MPTAFASPTIQRRLPRGTTDATLRRLFPKPSPYATDPEGWIADRLRERLWSKQRDIASSVVANRHTAVQSCHGIGKSYLAARLVAWWLDTHPVGEAFVVTTAPSAHQVNAVLWREIRRAHVKGELPGLITGGRGGSIPEWTVAGELVAFGRKPPDETDEAQAMQQFQGIHAPYVLAIIDEACGVDPWLFNAVETVTTGPNDRVLAIGNPDDPAAYFADVCAPGSAWERIKVSAFETPRFTGEPFDDRIVLISPEWVDERTRLPGWEPGGLLYTSKVLGDFPEASVDTLFPPRLLDRACQAVFPGLARGAYGVDVATYGDAETVVYRCRGRLHDDPRKNEGGVRVRLVEAAQGQDTEETADMVERIVGRDGRAGGVPVVVDGVGVGAGVVASLRRRGLAVIDHNGGSEPFDKEHFLNRRAEVFWRLRELAEAGQLDVDPADKGLLRQLRSIRYRHTAAGKVQVESKAEMRKRGLPSPDRADGAVYAVSGPVLETRYEESSPIGHVQSLTGDLLERVM